MEASSHKRGSYDFNNVVSFGYNYIIIICNTREWGMGREGGARVGRSNVAGEGVGGGGVDVNGQRQGGA